MRCGGEGRSATKRGAHIPLSCSSSSAAGCRVQNGCRRKAYGPARPSSRPAHLHELHRRAGRRGERENMLGPGWTKAAVQDAARRLHATPASSPGQGPTWKSVISEDTRNEPLWAMRRRAASGIELVAREGAGESSHSRPGGQRRCKHYARDGPISRFAPCAGAHPCRSGAGC